VAAVEYQSINGHICFVTILYQSDILPLVICSVPTVAVSGKATKGWLNMPIP
jgi:hypothetical protein